MDLIRQGLSKPMTEMHNTVPILEHMLSKASKYFDQKEVIVGKGDCFTIRINTGILKKSRIALIIILGSQI